MTYSHVLPNWCPAGVDKVRHRWLDGGNQSIWAEWSGENSCSSLTELSKATPSRSAHYCSALNKGKKICIYLTFGLNGSLKWSPHYFSCTELSSSIFLSNTTPVKVFHFLLEGLFHFWANNGWFLTQKWLDDCASHRCRLTVWAVLEKNWSCTRQRSLL